MLSLAIEAATRLASFGPDDGKDLSGCIDRFDQNRSVMVEVRRGGCDGAEGRQDLPGARTDRSYLSKCHLASVALRFRAGAVVGDLMSSVVSPRVGFRPAVLWLRPAISVAACTGDRCGDVCRPFVLPEAQHSPARRLQMS